MVEPQTPSAWCIPLSRGATAAPMARALVGSALQDLGLAVDRTIAQLLTVELVTNALKHTCDTEPIEVVVEPHGTGCRIEVHDNDPKCIKELLDHPLPLCDSVVVALDDSRAADGVSAAAVDSPAADGQRAVDDGPLVQGTGPAGRADDARRSDRGEGSGNTGESAETGVTEASMDTQTTGTPILEATETAEAIDQAPHPRGLVLLRSLSSDTGCRPTQRGKAIWFTLPGLPRQRWQAPLVHWLIGV